MGPKKVAFSPDQEAAMIVEIRNRPLLWDVSHANYRKTDLKEQHYEDIAKILGPPFTGEIMKDRFTSMKTNFGRNHRKVRESKNKCSGSDAEGIYKPSWPLYQSLLFLQKSCEQTECVSNLDSQNSSLVNTLADDISNNTYFDENMQAWFPVPHSPGTLQNSEVQSSLNGSSSRPTPTSTPFVVTNESTDASMDSVFSALSPVSVTESECVVELNPPRPHSAPGPRSESTPTSSKTFAPSPFTRRGANRKAPGLLQKAAEAMVKMADQDLNALIPPPPPPPSVQSLDHFDHFGKYVAGCLRTMNNDRAPMCQVEITKILNTCSD